MIPQPSQAPSHFRSQRVLLLNQFFWPDSAPTGLLLEDVARQLNHRGYDVTVICGQAPYLRLRTDAPPPVRIVRVPTPSYSRNPAGRIFSWASCLILVWIRATFSPRFDLIVTLTSPPGLSAIGAWLKKLRGSRFWIWEMDVYPDVAVALGTIKRGSLVERITRWALESLRRQADGILTLGPCMQERLSTQGLDPRKLHVAENWADGDLIQPSEVPPCPPLIIRYAGNLGLAHETDTIAQVMLRLKNHADFRFIFAGGGVRQSELEVFCKENQIGSVEFRPYLDRNAFGEGFASCHVGLVTLRAECVGTVVPSKVYSLLAAGRPFLYIGPRSGTASRIAAEGCGWQHEPGDVDGVVSLLEALRADVTIVRAAGLQARHIFEARYDREQGSRRVADILTTQDPFAKPVPQIRPEPTGE